MELVNLALKAMFVENMALAFFLGMCSFLAVSKKVETANGLGLAVVFVLTITTPINSIIQNYLLKDGAMVWLLGEETAASMGTNLARTRTLVIGGTALAVGAATAVSGVIGFVGLVIPHLLRPLVGHRPSRLLPASALGGALTLLVADILVRVVTPGTELKLGVVTALVGAPFFLWLVLNSRKATS